MAAAAAAAPAAVPSVTTAHDSKKWVPAAARTKRAFCQVASSPAVKACAERSPDGDVRMRSSDGSSTFSNSSTADAKPKSKRLKESTTTVLSSDPPSVGWTTSQGVATSSPPKLSGSIEDGATLPPSVASIGGCALSSPTFYKLAARILSTPCRTTCPEEGKQTDEVDGADPEVDNEQMCHMFEREVRLAPRPDYLWLLHDLPAPARVAVEHGGRRIDPVSGGEFVGLIHRVELFDWMMSLAMKFQLDCRTTQVALSIVDRVCAHAVMQRLPYAAAGKHPPTDLTFFFTNTYQGLGTTALWIACKLFDEDARSIAPVDFAMETGDAIDVDGMIRTEEHILQVLDWKVDTVTPYEWTRRFLADTIRLVNRISRNLASPSPPAADTKTTRQSNPPNQQQSNPMPQKKSNPVGQHQSNPVGQQSDPVGQHQSNPVGKQSEPSTRPAAAASPRPPDADTKMTTAEGPNPARLLRILTALQCPIRFAAVCCLTNCVLLDPVSLSFMPSTIAALAIRYIYGQFLFDVTWPWQHPGGLVLDHGLDEIVLLMAGVPRDQTQPLMDLFDVIGHFWRLEEDPRGCGVDEKRPVLCVRQVLSDAIEYQKNCRLANCHNQQTQEQEQMEEDLEEEDAKIRAGQIRLPLPQFLPATPHVGMHDHLCPAKIVPAMPERRLPAYLLHCSAGESWFLCTKDCPWSAGAPITRGAEKRTCPHDDPEVIVDSLLRTQLMPMPLSRNDLKQIAEAIILGRGNTWRPTPIAISTRMIPARILAQAVADHPDLSVALQGSCMDL